MYVESSKRVNFEGKVLMDPNVYSSHLKKIKKIVFNYPSTNEEKDLLIKEQDNILGNIVDLKKYLFEISYVTNDLFFTMACFQSSNSRIFLTQEIKVLLWEKSKILQMLPL